MMKSLSVLVCAAVAAFAGPAHADVVLQDAAGLLRLEGQLVTFDDETFTIQTEQGELIVRREFVSCEGPDCPGANASPPVPESNVVVLTSTDQSVRLEGTLIETTPTEFVIDTSGSVLRVRREFVTCEGPGCPVAEIDNINFAIAVPGTSSARLVSSIVGDYAKTKGYSVTRQPGTESGLPTLLVRDGPGLEVVARTQINRMGTSDAIRAVFRNEIAFAVTRERVSTDLLSQLTGNAVADVNDVLQETVIGLDAVSFFVGAGTTMDVINFETVNGILSGSVVNWSQIGTADAPVNVHVIADSEALVDVLKARGALRGDMLSNVTVHQNGEDFAVAVNADPTAFGVAYRSKVVGVKALNLATACRIFADNSDFSVQTEEHPLTVRLYKYERKDARMAEFAADIGRFIVTDFGRESIAATGLVIQALQIVPMQNQGARLLTIVLNGADDPATRRVMRTYLNEVSTARRISTNLRFVTDSTTLDSKAISDLERISEIVRSNDYEGYEVLVFGFSDSSGGLDTNITLSQRRSDAVRDLLLSKNVGYLEAASVLSFGTGPIAPVGCNATAPGREQNRRVEIWLRPNASL